ncbi:MAG TPA: hypothetical protein VFR52_05620 [Sphingomicrobium sp.]|nr:hypothetical protein [Sphingomicrobium sp.]
MATATNRTGFGWGTRLLLGIALMLAGAAGAAWALARYEGAARFFGVAPRPDVVRPVPRVLTEPPPEPTNVVPESREIARIENRLAQVETTTQRVEGSAGRADALLVAFAARRAIDRGVALGYLEPLLLDRFGQTHARAVATIITGSHTPVRLASLVDQYRELGPQLRSGAAQEGTWTQFKRELNSLIKIRRADRPSTQPDARYLRALRSLENGEVDVALAETMRLPGAANAQPWIRQARQYVAVHRALDEIESGALLARTVPAAS